MEAQEVGLMTRSDLQGIAETLLAVIISDNRRFEGTAPPIYRRRKHIQECSRYYDMIMKELEAGRLTETGTKQETLP